MAEALRRRTVLPALGALGALALFGLPPRAAQAQVDSYPSYHGVRTVWGKEFPSLKPQIGNRAR